MSNISLTQRCNRSCAYCFAQDVMRLTGRDGAFMTLEEFDDHLRFLERSAVDEVKLLGGEPTIHPEFCRMVGSARDRGFRVLVLSGGVIPEDALGYLERAGDDWLSVMMNVIPPGAFSQYERERQAAAMSRLGSKVALGLNIDTRSTPLNFLIPLIKEHGLQRTVRLGLAHPIVGASSEYLRAKDYPAVGRRVAAFFWRAQEESIRLEFDCGWVPCMFPDGFIDESGIAPEEVGLRCNPIIDVLPGRKAIACYPLAALAMEPVSADRDDAGLTDAFIAKLTPYRPLKLYKHCDSCSLYEQGKCVGGCIAGAMTRLRTPMVFAETTRRILWLTADQS